MEINNTGSSSSSKYTLTSEHQISVDMSNYIGLSMANPAVSLDGSISYKKSTPSSEQSDDNTDKQSSGKTNSHNALEQHSSTDSKHDAEENEIILDENLDSGPKKKLVLNAKLADESDAKSKSCCLCLIL